MNPLSPPASVIVKLGSIARHVEELCGPQPHVLDQHALEALLGDPEVQEWMKAADGVALLPVPRNAA
jgi:hypothetical protein